MPGFQNRWVFEIGRKIRLFFQIEAELKRTGNTTESKQSAVENEKAPGKLASGPAIATIRDQPKPAVSALRKRLAERNRSLERVRKEIVERDQKIARLQAQLASEDSEAEGIKPENVIWLFGTGRSGSTWLASMLGDLSGHDVWHEPLVGELFGHLYFIRASEKHHRNRHFILGSHKETWQRSIKSFVLEGANARFPELVHGGHLVIKEPNGSIGAPLLMEALPESRMIFLIRDPRDVVASVLDSFKEGGWNYKNIAGNGEHVFAGDGQLDTLLKTRANRYVQDIDNTRKAYEAHQGHKTLVKYERLRTDTLNTLKQIQVDLEINVDQEELTQIVEKHSWESISEEKKGQGKFYRKATPGGWREDLTPEQIEVVENTTAPLLEEFYPE